MRLMRKARCCQSLGGWQDSNLKTVFCVIALAHWPSGDRITKLRNCGNLEAAAYAHLKHLGELKRPYLTQLSEKLLRLLEQEYEVNS